MDYAGRVGPDPCRIGDPCDRCGDRQRLFNSIRVGGNTYGATGKHGRMTILLGFAGSSAGWGALMGCDQCDYRRAAGTPGHEMVRFAYSDRIAVPLLKPEHHARVWRGIEALMMLTRAKGSDWVERQVREHFAGIDPEWCL